MDDVLPSDGGKLEFILLNAVTIVTAMTGMALSLSLVQRWGLRIPSRLILFGAWVAAGFLISMLPFIAVAAATGPPSDGGMPKHLAAFAATHVTGMVAGLGLLGILRRRTPAVHGTDETGRDTRRRDTGVTHPKAAGA